MANTNEVTGGRVEKPVVFDTKSVKLELQPGSYAWCACGQSKNQPWCDGSHKGGAFSPVRFTVAEPQMKSMCLCKQSKNAPFCDGSHKPLREAAMAKAMPERYRGALPSLCCKDTAKAIAWYISAFGAREEMRLAEPSGRVGRAELRIGDALFMLADEFPEFGIFGPSPGVRPPVSIGLQSADVDAMVQRAVAAGAKVLSPVQDQFYGDRSGTIQDPFGYVWRISTHKEDVTPQEMQRRYDAMMKG